jgi:hypothetical protein
MLGSGYNSALMLKHTGQTSVGPNPTSTDIMFYFNDRLAPTLYSIDELLSFKVY